jgi:hypothetical protein
MMGHLDTVREIVFAEGVMPRFPPDLEQQGSDGLPISTGGFG